MATRGAVKANGTPVVAAVTAAAAVTAVVAEDDAGLPRQAVHTEEAAPFFHCALLKASRGKCFFCAMDRIQHCETYTDTQREKSEQSRRLSSRTLHAPEHERVSARDALSLPATAEESSEGVLGDGAPDEDAEVAGDKKLEPTGDSATAEEETAEDAAEAAAKEEEADKSAATAADSLALLRLLLPLLLRGGGDGAGTSSASSSGI